MRPSTVIRILLIPLLFVAITPFMTVGVSAQSEQQLKNAKLQVFGDSLSDSGNLFALTGGFIPPPPFYQERFTDGPVWTEYLVDLLDMKTDLRETVAFNPLAANQAVGGAFTDDRNSNAVGPFLFLDGTGISGQVDAFTAAGGSIKKKDLVVVWGGANNYVIGQEFFIDQVVADLADAVARLAAVGGRRFIVPNLPDLGRTPLASSLDPAVAAALTTLTLGHNAVLAGAMATLAVALDIQIVVLDIKAAFDDLLDPTKPPMLPNTVFPCLDGVGAPTGACPPDDDGVLDSSGAVFWDPLHPTTTTHGLIAFFAKGVILDAFVTAPPDDKI